MAAIEDDAKIKKSIKCTNGRQTSTVPKNPQEKPTSTAKEKKKI